MKKVTRLDYIDTIMKMPIIHCARGPERCDRCRKRLEEGEKFCLVRIYLEASYISRPMTQVNVDDKKIFAEYDVLKIFENVEEAKEYATKNDIEITIS